MCWHFFVRPRSAQECKTSRISFGGSLVGYSAHTNAAKFDLPTFPILDQILDKLFELWPDVTFFGRDGKPIFGRRLLEHSVAANCV